MGISKEESEKSAPSLSKKIFFGLFHNSLLPENVTIVFRIFPKSCLDHVAWEFHL
jgi:hypothetical protein